MVLGCLLSFIVFGSMAYFLARLALRSGYEKDSRFLAVLFYFLAPLIVLSIVTCIIVGLYSLLGFSMSLGAEAIARSLNANSNGALVIIGSIITAIFGIAAIAAGPATAFTASQFSTLIAAVTVAVQRDEEFCLKWLPWVAFATYGFCMWPFAAMLTFGL